MQNTPKLRFDGFSDAWEQRKLSDILERRIEHRQQSEDYPRLAFASGQGVIPLSERKTNNREQLTKDEFTKSYLVTELNDIVYNPANVKYGAIDRNKYGRGLISPIYVTFISKEVPGYIERIVTSHDFQQRALKYEEGTVTKRQAVNPEDLVTLEIPVSPIKEEQENISAFFDNLDTLIILYQRRCNVLASAKQFYLQNMFPQKGETTPRIRFDRFTDAWEKRKLGDTFDFLSNNTLSRVELSVDSGPAKNVHYGDVLIKFGEYLNASTAALPFIPSHQIMDKFKGSLLQDGDVIMADTAEDEAVGKCTEIAGLQGFPTISGLHTIPLRPKEKFAPGYLGYYMNSGSYHDQLLPLMQGTKVTSVSKGAILNTGISYPADCDEQAKIGSFFIQLDTLIALHQRKVSTLKTVKQFMLQNLFPRED